MKKKFWIMAILAAALILLLGAAALAEDVCPECGAELHTQQWYYVGEEGHERYVNCPNCGYEGTHRPPSGRQGDLRERPQMRAVRNEIRFLRPERP